MDLRGTGVWSPQLRYADRPEVAEAAAELEQLGYAAAWIPEGDSFPIMEASGALLRATERIPVATGIVNVWRHGADEIAAGFADLEREHPGRFLLGLGISHAEIFGPGEPNPYRRPVATMAAYVDDLVAADPGVPRERCVLAALGPRMVELSGRATAGAHPYLSTPGHTARAREVLGPGPLLAPEQAVVLEREPVAARATGRAHVSRYLDLPNFARHLLSLGFEENDLAGGGSDRLVDGIVAWGDVATIAERVREHHRAGADHVGVQVLGSPPEVVPLAQLRELAPALC